MNQLLLVKNKFILKKLNISIHKSFKSKIIDVSKKKCFVKYRNNEN